MTDSLDSLQDAFGSRYRIEREIGSGGMATVYLAHDEKLGRDVALKVLRPELAASLGAERFLREIEIAANLNHPNILGLHDCGNTADHASDSVTGSSTGYLYYTMPFVAGESLRERLDREKQLPLEDALQIAQEVADALGHAHAMGLVHRDIKPENILLESGHAVVTDFGIARAITHAGSEKLTETGIAIGTPAYMSPEQSAGNADVDARSDIYSLGCVLYEMLGGDTPYTASTPQALIAKKLSEPTPRIGVIRETVPVGVEAALTKALAKTPADRFVTAHQFVEALFTPSSGIVMGGHHTKGGRWKATAVILAVVATALLALNVGGVRGRLTGNTVGEAEVLRMAVLPFENLTGDPEQEYLSDGLTEEMIAQLGRMHPEGLHVTGRRSVMRYKNSDTPIDQIGRDLNVDYVLAGNTRRDAGQIRINVELIRAPGQTQVWTESYESELSGILALQSDVVRRVAESLALELLPAETERLASVRSVDPAAYEAYVLGTQSRRALTVGGLETAERYFRRALEIDPGYAAAWAGISRVWNGRGQMGITPPKEAIRNSKEAVLRALAIDESEWAAHRSLAGILTWGDWDWPAAERQWNRLLRINPNEGEMLASHSHFLMIVGRPDEAMAQIERAMQLDPFNIKIRSFYVMDLVYVRRFDDAIAEAREILRLQPDAPVARSGLYYALFVTGMLDEALAEDRTKLDGDRERMHALESGYAEGGYTGAQQRIADLRASQYGTPGGPAAHGIALRYLYAGNHDRAFEWLERAYQDNDGNMPYLGLPIFDGMRSDSRFQDLRRRLNLPR